MTLQAVLRYVVLVLTLLQSVAFAEEVPDPPFVPTDSSHANWLFSGLLTNENGDQYGYFFQVERAGNHVHATSALLDGQSKQLIVFEDTETEVKDPSVLNWKMGRMFMRFNPITESWIFGLKANGNAGFNLKADMLSRLRTQPIEDLRKGIDLIVGQTSRVNGHIYPSEDAKEEFVTAAHNWFRQVWQSEAQDKYHPFSGVLCQNSEGDSFYSVNMRESDAHRGAVTGAYNAKGQAQNISQFVSVKLGDDNLWHIRVPSPKQAISFTNLLKDASVVGGFSKQNDSLTFCIITRDSLAKEQPSIITPPNELNAEKAS